MSQFVNAMKPYLPNAAFSMDISPWVGTNNNTGGDGADNGKNWYSYFDMNLFTFINTSGGGTQAGAANIRGDKMTWAGVSQATGKPILADTGYGVNGSSSGPDAAWDSASQHQRPHERRRHLNHPVQPVVQLGLDNLVRCARS